jgi:pimeloyl-ACP methyl ester carboxylesterase
MGCRIVLEAARRHPDVVAGVVLVDGSRMADSDDPEKAVAEGMDILSRIDAVEFARMAFEAMFERNRESRLRQAALVRIDRLDPAFAEAAMVAIWRWDAAELKPALQSIDAPILVLQSTHIDHRYEWDEADGHRPNPWIELVIANAPQAEVCIISGAGHFTHIDAPDQVNAELDRLARQIADQGGLGA